MGSVTAFRKKHHEVVTEATNIAEDEIAVMSLEKLGLKAISKIAGKIITPAKWLFDYTTDGKLPGKIDAGLYGIGAFIEGAEPPALAVGLVKSAVDDDIKNKLAAVRKEQESKYRQYIHACYYYGMSPPKINAEIIASKGGTAWRSKNGLWVYIIDRRGHLVADFHPLHATMIMQPVIPLQVRGGRFKWAVK